MGEQEKWLRDALILVQGMRKGIFATGTISPLMLQIVLVETAGFVLNQTDLKNISIPKLLM